MLKLFNRKKKDNKGFTLVELVIVVAILAILVGLLAPQYTKYVEKSRKTADANNLEEIVKQIKVVCSDQTYAVPEGKFTIVMDTADGTTITFAPTNAKQTTTGESWTKGMTALLEGKWDDSTDDTLKNKDLDLKSNKWSADATVAGLTPNDHKIGADITVKSDGTMVVDYNPASIKEGSY